MSVFGAGSSPLCTPSVSTPLSFPLPLLLSLSLPFYASRVHLPLLPRFVPVVLPSSASPALRRRVLPEVRLNSRHRNPTRNALQSRLSKKSAKKSRSPLKSIVENVCPKYSLRCLNKDSSFDSTVVSGCGWGNWGLSTDTSPEGSRGSEGCGRRGSVVRSGIPLYRSLVSLLFPELRRERRVSEESPRLWGLGRYGGVSGTFGPAVERRGSRSVGCGELRRTYSSTVTTKTYTTRDSTLREGRGLGSQDRPHNLRTHKEEESDTDPRDPRDLGDLGDLDGGRGTHHIPARRGTGVV